MKKVIQDHEGLCYNRLMKAPRNVKKYFWEADVNNLKSQKDAQYIIARLLEYGNPKAVKWLLETYPKAKIRSVAKTSRNISGRTKAFWSGV